MLEFRPIEGALDIILPADSYLAIIRFYNQFWLYKWSSYSPQEILWNDIHDQLDLVAIER